MSTRTLDRDRRLRIPAEALAELLRKQNPDASAALLRQISALIAPIAEIAAALPAGKRQQALRRKEEIAHAVLEVATAEPGRLAEVAPRRKSLPAGAGLGQVLPEAKAAARLHAYATPVPLADWAGEVERPAALAERLGIARSTLDSWRQRGRVIALPKGMRAHVYPVEQFEADRPLEGLGAVRDSAAGNDRVAWGWLRTPHAAFRNRPPLEALRRGRVGEVVEAARRDLG